MIDWDDYPNFVEAEFACKCGCGLADMDPDFMRRLQAIRDDFGRPMIITSGFRCPAHNDAIGGGPEHVLGLAADVRCRNPVAEVLNELRIRHQMPRFGVSQRRRKPRFVHIGGSFMLPKAIWSY